jgi:hypothetical protein
MRQAHQGHGIPLLGEDLGYLAGAHHLVLGADLGTAATGEYHEGVHGTLGSAVGVEGLGTKRGILVWTDGVRDVLEQGIDERELTVVGIEGEGHVDGGKGRRHDGSGRIE